MQRRRKGREWAGRGLLVLALAAFSARSADAFVKSVEYKELVLGAAQASATVSLTRSQTAANCVPFASSMASTGSTAFGSSFADVFLTAGSPPTLTAQRTLTGGTVTVGVYVVEFDPAYVRVQRGTFSLAAGSTGPVTVGLTTAVDLARAALLFYTRNDFPSNSNGWNDVAVEGVFSATNQVAFQRGASTPTVDGHWYVFEALNVSGSYSFAVQTKSFTFAVASGTSTALAPSVPSSATFVVGSYWTAAAGDRCDRGAFQLYLSGCAGGPVTCTSVTADSYAGNASVTVTAFVITFPSGVSVQRGSLSYAASGGGATLQTATLSPALMMAKTMVWNSFGAEAGVMRANEGSGDQMFMAQQRLKLASPTSVQGNRAGGTVTAVGTWEAVEFGVATAVDLQSFSATARDEAVDLDWSTASELQNLGFHLYRGDSADGPFVRITSSLIPGLGSSPTGRSYSYRDGGLSNGRTYFYELEDVETTGRTELHGPVSAAPSASAGAGETPPSPSSPAPTATSHGDHPTVVLREVERSPRHVVVELLTSGFVATPTDGGRVRLTIPGLESASAPGAPELPMRRALVDVAAGRNVRLASVVANDVLRFPELRPTSQGAREIEVSEEGTVRPASRATREGRAFREGYPREWARLEGTLFLGETKKAEVRLFPLRWDGSGLELSRRLLVRLEFAGTEATETSRGGSRGRRARKAHPGDAALAQIVVKERGLYRVAYEDLFSAATGGRRPRGLPLSSLRLSRQGESVAFHVEPQGVPFSPGSSLYFVSAGSSLNPYGDAAYELETNARGLQMEVETLFPRSGAVDEYFPTVEREENTYYQPGLLDAPDLWLWDVVVSPGTKSFAFTVDELAMTSSSAHLSVALQAASDVEGIVDHHVRVGVNGVPVGEGSWDGKLPYALETDLPAGILREGENALEIEDVGDTGASYSMVFLDRFSIGYPRRLVATTGRLEGRFDASGVATVEGVSSGVLLETSGVPRWLQGTRATTEGLSFPVQAGKTYLLTSSVLRPEVRLLEPSTLRSRANQADYLVLAPQAFLEAARPLLERRRSQGLKTSAVSLEEVFAQFGHGEASPLAVKAFLEYAYQTWAEPSLRYVLLLGDASYDPKDYLQTGVKDWLPGFPVKTSFLWTVSDPAYASVNGDDLFPDLAIGRLPAGSLDEAQRMVQKILAYENGGFSLDGPAVLVADNADRAGNFEADADEIASTLLAGRNPSKIYYSQLGPTTRAGIIDAFDRGASLMSYVGHGATTVWASENIFNLQDVAKLAFQPRQPLLLTLDCLNGFFQFPPLDSLGEALLKADGKGAIAAFSPSGLSVEDAAHVFHKAVLAEILSGKHERLGDAVFAAQRAYAESGAFPELLSVYTLLGDPALSLR